LDQGFYEIATSTKKTKGESIMIFDPITCHGQSWGNYCLVCEDEMLEQHAKENDVEREYEKEQV
jgi:hypothetical protein